MKHKPWPTPELPLAPVSVATHGPVCQWAAEQWREWQAWADGLKDYGGERVLPIGDTGSGTTVPAPSTVPIGAPVKMSTIVDKGVTYGRITNTGQ